MKNKFARAGLVAGALIAAIALAQDPAPRVLGLMKSVIVPASDAVYAVGKTAPKSDREWAAVEASAARIVEAGKSLAGEAPAGAASWIKLSNAMAEAAAVAGKAAREKNVDGVLDAGDALNLTCEDCHREYVKK